MTSFSKDLPSALEFSWEAKCEEISVLLHSQPCCRLGIAPDHPPARHFCSSRALLSSSCLPKATQGHDTNITNYTEDPEGINYLKGPGWETRKSSPSATLIDLWQLCHEALRDLCNDTNSKLKPLSTNPTKQNKVIQQQSLFISSGSRRKKNETFSQVNSRFVEFWF